MTPDQLTQVAAQRCADLANAVEKGRGNYESWGASDFERNTAAPRTALRREVEAKDAMIREVLALLDGIENAETAADEYRDTCAARKILRANLLPDEKPTLLEAREVWRTAADAGLSLTQMIALGVRRGRELAKEQDRG